MERSDKQQRDRLRHLDRLDLERFQLQRFNSLLRRVLPENAFYQRRFGTSSLSLDSLAGLQQLPTATKSDFVQAASSEKGFHTFPRTEYVRFHRTSGTQGKPLVVMDTSVDWNWWIDTWQYVLDVAEVLTTDIAFMAFSFGPFVGFWSACDALLARGTMVIPGGGMSTVGRISLMIESQATVLCCTPTYALHMAEVAEQQGVDLRATKIRRLIVAGEPGGSLPEVRHRLESQWDASVIDHSGATEVGPWGVGTPDGTSLQVIESEFIAEFFQQDGRPAGEGELSELVLTNLGRAGAPAIRYRTGDLVKPRWRHDDFCRFVRLEGGVLGRADDMVVVRGVNIFPSSVESVIRSFPELGEFRIMLSKRGEMDQILVQVEDPLEDAERIVRAFEQAIGLRISVELVPFHSLDRFEAKARRVIDNR